MAKLAAQASVKSSVSVKKNLLSKMVQVGTSTLLSRIFGLARELLTSKYLGVGELADAFLTAFKIPNSLRKIFAEGALSAACVPTFVKVIKEDNQKEASRLMTLSFLFFEGILLVLCGVIFWKADAVIRLIAPGWFLVQGMHHTSSTIPFLGSLLSWIAPAWYSATPLAGAGYYASIYLRILISFIIFLSSSSLLAGALQSVNHFFIPALSSVLLNVVFIGGLLVCLKFGLSIEWLCYAIVLGGVLQFLLHVIMYFRLHFTFGSINSRTVYHFKKILKKFIPCLISMSILELNLFIGTSLATYLPKGSIALLYYANRFMGIPLGVLIGAFSTILLPYFSRISTYAPKRLSIYLFEASKVIFWVTVPCTVLMSFLSEKIFQTLFISDKFTPEHAHQAAQLLIIFLSGLFFFSLYKILLNIYYALHDTITPCYISLLVLAIYYMLSKLCAPLFGVQGLALAFVLTNIIHVTLFALLLRIKFKFTFYTFPFIRFISNALMQTSFLVLVFGIGYFIMQAVFSALLHQQLFNFFFNKIGFWLWVSPLCLLTGYLLIKTRKFFNIQLYFLD